MKVGGHLSPPWCLSSCPRVDLTSKAWWLKASGALGEAWVGQRQPGRLGERLKDISMGLCSRPPGHCPGGYLEG